MLNGDAGDDMLTGGTDNDTLNGNEVFRSAARPKCRVSATATK